MSNGADDEIMLEETRVKIGKLKSDKAGGVCEIQVEMLKAGGEVIVKWLTAIFNMVWKIDITPKEWRRAIIITIYKKGRRAGLWRALEQNGIGPIKGQ